MWPSAAPAATPRKTLSFWQARPTGAQAPARGPGGPLLWHPGLCAAHAWAISGCAHCSLDTAAPEQRPGVSQPRLPVPEHRPGQRTCWFAKCLMPSGSLWSAEGSLTTPTSIERWRAWRAGSREHHCFLIGRMGMLAPTFSFQPFW